MIARAVVSCLMLAVAAASAAAQQLRGTVRDSASRLPIPGAVITTLDSLGRVGRRSITDERGAYFITAPSAARRLRLVRLGFRPVEAELPTSRGDVTTLDVVMTRIPYQLQQVRVTAGASCPRRSDRRAALALLEQARAGLLATVVARSDKPARMKRLMIERRMDGTSDRIARHSVRIDSVASAEAAFGATRTATDFIRQGFAADSADDRIFYAPDADVLLDDGFSAGYCFHIMDRERRRPNQVGLGFKAADRRRGRIDVDGALWIDTVARALVDIEFRYVGLDAREARFEPGGHVGFREMTNGVVLIDRWFLRLVGLEPATVHGGRHPALVGRAGERTPAGPVRFVLADVGGELASATWDDGFVWKAPLGTLALSVTTDGGQPSVGTMVRLDDTDYEGTTDSTGYLEIHDLAPGPYASRIADSRLDNIGLTLATRLTFAATRDSVVRLRLVAKTAEQYVGERCRAERPVSAKAYRDGPVGDAWLIGRVTAPDGTPVKGAIWAMRTMAAGDLTTLVAGAETGSDGIFVSCRATLGSTVLLEFRRKGMENGMTSRALTDRLTVLALQMTPVAKRQ